MNNIKKTIQWFLPILLRAFVIFLERELVKQAVRLGEEKRKTKPEATVKIPSDFAKRFPKRVVMEPIIFIVKNEADEVLEQMNLTVQRYDVVSVSDLYELLGQPSQYSDNKYGWTNLSSLEVTDVSPGIWGLYFPVPVLLPHDA